jgi:hypothetical protein
MFPFFKILGGGIFAGGAGGEAVSFTHLAREEVTGSAVTTVTFSGLTLANRAAFLLTGRILQSNTSTYSMHLNGNTTDADYRNQWTFGSGASLSSSRVANPQFLTTIAGDDPSFNAFITFNGGRAHVIAESVHGSTSGNIDSFESRIVDITNSYTNITSIAVTANTANEIEVGSIFDLFALEADAV